MLGIEDAVDESGPTSRQGVSHLACIDPSHNTCINIGYLEHRLDLGVSYPSFAPNVHLMVVCATPKCFAALLPRPTLQSRERLNTMSQIGSSWGFMEVPKKAPTFRGHWSDR